jgi:hypothetical protein
MNAEQTYVSEEAFLSPVIDQPTTWKLNTELSNIISLAEQGLLHSPKPEDAVDEDLGYPNYSPLNEW